ncbi:hypothetical protein [Lederbergia graminis]|uniref:Uncharacterized protein n=1 Tax=Lederbergia graminis TaxID=735518 RepID=A0ABW0LJW2_9BACI
MKLKDIKNVKLEKIKIMIDLTATRSAGKKGLDWLISNDIKTVGDLISSETLIKLKKKFQTVLQIIPRSEVFEIVESEVNEVIKRDPSYSDETIAEMKKQHTYCWELLLRDQLFILSEDKVNDNPVIWCRDLSDDEIGEYAKKNHLYINQDEELDFGQIVDIELRKDFSNQYFVKGDLYFKELFPFIKDFLIPLPINTKVKKSTHPLKNAINLFMKK